MLAPAPAMAQVPVPVPVRVANFPGYGRVVFDFTGPTSFDAAEDGDQLRIVFDGAPALAPAHGLPRNVRAIQGAAGSATLVLAPGARFRSSRNGNRVIIDVLDPVPNRPGRKAVHAATLTQPDGMLPSPTLPTPVAAPSPPAEPEPAARATGTPLAAPMIGVTQDALPSLADPASSTATPVKLKPASMLIPFEPGVGAAAFRRADVGLVVFDKRVPVDVAILQDGPAFAASVQLGHAVTILTIPLGAGQALALLHEPQGWRVTRTDGATAAPAIDPEFSAAGLSLKLESPGQVVTVLDPSTGLTLLVGTIAPTAGPGAATKFTRRAPGYALASTWLGVVVEPLSDLVELHPAASGFVLIAPDAGPLAAAPAQPAEVLTRRFELPDLTVPALMQRLMAQTAAAAAAPPRARTSDRMAAARSMLSLGLATEAQAVFGLIATEDPAAADDPDLNGLMAIAALLAGRSPEASGLDDPRLDGTDEIALWRAVRDAMRDINPDTGRDLARLLPLASAYPVALRDRLRPLMVEASIGAGQATSVASALAQLDDATLDYARALLRERDGDNAGALLALDALAVGRDQLTQSRAGVLAAELRLRDGTSTVTQAADALERQATIWRGDARESRIRLRVAELRTAAGAFRAALDMLRDTEQLFPDQRPAVRAAMAVVFAAMLSHPQAVAPLEFVTLTGDYATLLQGGVDGIPALLADKLVALDLPNRAGPVLAALMAAAPAGAARAGLGAQLAQMQLDNAAAPAALAALRASDAPDLPASLIERRALLLARARVSQGDLPGAIAMLAALGSAAADDMRATLLGQAADWPGSIAALSDLAAKTIPVDGPLSDSMQDIVMRQATSAVQANDKALLAELRRRYGARMADARADLFRLLTAEPVQLPSDLPRAATELAMARRLPDRLHGLTAGDSR